MVLVSRLAWLMLFVAGLGACTRVEPPPPKTRVIVRVVKQVVPAPVLRPNTAQCKPAKLTCSKMATCVEALHYFLECGEAARKLDKEGRSNGIPCEDLCVRDGQQNGTVDEKKKEMCRLVERAPLFEYNGVLSRGNVSVCKGERSPQP